MARRSNKLTIHVTPNRTTQTVVVRTSGKFGKKMLSIQPQRVVGASLSPTTSTGGYWIDVLHNAEAMVAGIP